MMELTIKPIEEEFSKYFFKMNILLNKFLIELIIIIVDFLIGKNF